MTLRRFFRLLWELRGSPLASGKGSPLFRVGRHDLATAATGNTVAALIAVAITTPRASEDYLLTTLAMAVAVPLALLLKLRPADERRAMLENLHLAGMGRDEAFVALFLPVLRLMAAAMLPWLVVLTAILPFGGIHRVGLLAAPGVTGIAAGAAIIATLTMFRRACASARQMAVGLGYLFLLAYQGLILTGVLSMLLMSIDIPIPSPTPEQMQFQESVLIGVGGFGTFLIGVGLLLKRFVHDGPELLFSAIDRAPLRAKSWVESEPIGAERAAASEAYSRQHGLRWMRAIAGGALLALLAIAALAFVATKRHLGPEQTIWMPADGITTKVAGPEELAIARDVVAFLAIHGFQNNFAFAILVPVFTALLLARPFARGAMPVRPGTFKPFLGRAMLMAALVFLVALADYASTGFGLLRTRDDEELMFGAFRFSIAAPAALLGSYTVFLTLVPSRRRGRRVAFWLVAAATVALVPIFAIPGFTRHDFYYYEFDWPATVAPLLFVLMALLGLLYFNSHLLNRLHRECLAEASAAPEGEKTLVRTPSDSHL